MSSPEQAAVPVHRRSIVVDSFDRGEEFVVVATLRDERPWHDARAVLHDMELRLTVRAADLTITAAEAQMRTFPHEECPLITPKFAELVGLSVTRGFTRALRERFAGVSGCQHLHELARVTGPAVFQASAARRSRIRAESGADDSGAMRGSLVGTCHIWSSGGAGEQKLALGWRPGNAAYPAPSVDQLRPTE
jgi:hypothetical protein